MSEVHESDEMAGNGDLIYDRSWSLDDRKLDSILERIRTENATRILEFGSGWSTLALALEFPQHRIVSIEHDPEFHFKTQSLLEEYDAQERVDLRLCPLRLSENHGRRAVTYAFDPGSEEFDFVIIDGPPRWVPRGREAALTRVFDNLVARAVVLLDDGPRQEEQLAKSYWQRRYGAEIEFERLLLNDEMIVAIKTDHKGHMSRWTRTMSRMHDLMIILRSFLGSIRVREIRISNGRS